MIVGGIYIGIAAAILVMTIALYIDERRSRR